MSFLAPGYPAALFEVMAELIDAELGFEVGRSGPDPAFDPFRSGVADLGWVCSTSFVELTTEPVAEPGAGSVAIAGLAWVPDDPGAGGRPVYYSDLVVRPDSQVRDLADLAGCRVGCNDPASLSGFHALRIELGRRGHDPDGFADLVLTGGHHHSIDRLLAHEVDAAVIDSVVLRRRARQWADVSRLRVVQRLGPWPTQPLVMRSDLDTDSATEVVRRLRAANDDPEMIEVFRASAIDRLVPVGPDHCDPVRRAMEALEPPHRALPAPTGEPPGRR